MPHIKEIRLINVHFNNATQFYDDFKMKLEGKNATYDLENGGGKSLLLLMLMQTVLPKSYLRKEKPVSLLFQGGKDRTSHVAVEWILEEGSQYKYLLTGFNARKRRGAGNGTTAGEEDENVTAGDIEHINWCVFYNDNKIAGIRSVPLCSGVAEGNILLKLLQAGLVSFEITGLEKEKEKERLLTEQSDLQEEHKELGKKYFDAMALEEYDEYRKAKSRLLKAQKSLSVLETDMDKVNEDYRTAGGKLKYLLNQNFTRVRAAESELKSSLTGIDAEKQAKNDELIGHEKQKSTLEAEINKTGAG